MKTRRFTGPTFPLYKKTKKQRVRIIANNLYLKILSLLVSIFPRLTNGDQVDIAQKVYGRMLKKKRYLRLLDKTEVELFAFEQCSFLLKKREIHLSEQGARRLADDIGRREKFPASAIGVRAGRIIIK